MLGVILHLDEAGIRVPRVAGGTASDGQARGAASLSLVLLVLLLRSELLCRVLFAEAMHGDCLKASAGTLWVRLAGATCLVAGIYFALAPVVEGEILAAHFGNVRSFFFSFFC